MSEPLVMDDIRRKAVWNLRHVVQESISGVNNAAFRQ